MQKHIFILSFSFLSLTNLGAQVIDTVSTGPGYTNQVWYNLASGQETRATANNWDIGFSTTFNARHPLTTSVLFNQLVGRLFEVPGSSVANFNTIDTTGLHTWKALFNSDSSWTEGAFNNTVSQGSFDYGWGRYDMVTHSKIEANRVFVIRYNNGSIRKLYLNLFFSDNGFKITSANLDNSDLRTRLIPFAPYNKKNFVYYAIQADTLLNREPDADAWDLQFTRYISVTERYNGALNQQVTGVLHNVYASSSEAKKVNKATFTDFQSSPFLSAINTIGFDWKKVDMSAPPFPWRIMDSTVYFVKTGKGDIWKLVFTGFGGSSNGNYIFTKEKLQTTNIYRHDAAIGTLSLYPNPVSGGRMHILYQTPESNAPVALEVYNTHGQRLLTRNLPASAALVQEMLDVSALANGPYLMVLSTQGKRSTTKFIINN